MSDVLSAFAHVQKSGAGWTARCPAHDDARNSLALARGDKQPWVLRCHAGCDTDAILAAAGLTMADLLQPRDVTAPSRREPVAIYDYTDEGGTLLYQVCRFVPKDFRQRRPNGQGGWTWALGDVRRVLFGLPHLHGQPVVYIPEGERDVLALRDVGLCATCNAGGAGKWRDDYTQQLVAAGVQRVVILPDNDEPGRAHAQHVAESCRAAGLEVKVVPLLGLPPKGDVSDWLSTGHTRADLVAAVKATPSHAAPAQGIPLESPDIRSRTPIVTFLDTVTPEPIDWLWTGRIARGKYTLLAGEPGLGKTYLMLDVASRVSRGLAWPDGTRASQGRVLYLTAEDGLADTLRPRIDEHGGDPSQIAVLEAVREPDGSRSALSLVKDLDILTAAIRDVQPQVVIIDPITAYLGSVDTHRDSEVRAALAPVIDTIEQQRCALVAIGHLSKDAQKAALHRPGGSIAFVAAARIVLALASDPQDPTRRLLAPLKANICRPSSVLAYRVGEQGLAWEADAVADVDVEAMFRPASPGEREDRSDAEALLSQLLRDDEAWPMDAKDAMKAGEAHGVHERTLRRAARRLGIRIDRVGFGRSGKWLWHRPVIPDTAIPDSLPRAFYPCT